MLSLLFALLIGMIGSVASSYWLESQGWIITMGIIVFIFASILFNRYFGKKLHALVNEVQELLTGSQEEAMKMINRFQSKPVGSQKIMQDKVEKSVETGVLQALEKLENSRPLYKWNVLAERQINTLKMQLYFQIKQFDEVDRLLPKILVLEPLTLAMKMARQYKNDSPELEKSYLKGIKKFKYEKAVLIYALYSWILAKRKEYDKALVVLAEAKEKTDDETILRNWQHVANNKIHLFSNAGLGDQWYSLHLEKPPRQKVGKGQLKGNPMAPKGKRRFF